MDKSAVAEGIIIHDIMIEHAPILRENAYLRRPIASVEMTVIYPHGGRPSFDFNEAVIASARQTRLKCQSRDPLTGVSAQLNQASVQISRDIIQNDTLVVADAR